MPRKEDSLAKSGLHTEAQLDKQIKKELMRALYSCQPWENSGALKTHGMSPLQTGKSFLKTKKCCGTNKLIRQAQASMILEGLQLDLGGFFNFIFYF